MTASDRIRAARADGFDDGYSRAVDVIERGQHTGRMAPPEYFWHYDFRFDLREATRGEQEAVRTLMLAQKLDLDGISERHVELVELILGHRSVARGAVRMSWSD